MSLGGKPKIPAAVTPAARPERTDDVKPEDIQMGDSASNDTTRKGKRALMRPSSVSPVGVGTTGGTGLSV